MKNVTIRNELLAAMFTILVGLPVTSSADGRAEYQQTYTEVTGEVLLENDRIVVQKFAVPPGRSTGVRTGASDAALVFVRGGQLTSKESGRVTLWKDGRVVWRDVPERADEDAVNTGSSPVEFVWVTLKPAPATRSPSGQSPKYRYLTYPNIPGEDVLENDLVIVQRFAMIPGQWEGVHAHHPDMLYIFVKGGRWASRSRKHPEPIADSSPDGAVGWMPTMDITEGHESGNIGTTPSDVIWITLKR
jgi:quercetin dioxygenase-like cupin family protein